MPSSDVRAWLGKASEDEQTVALIRAAEGPWSVAAYHVQQATEKRIKAVLAACGVPPPKSHDLTYLLSLLPGEPDPSVEAAAAMVSAYAWLTRYPGAPPITAEQVNTAEEHLSTVRYWSDEAIAAMDRPSA